MYALGMYGVRRIVRGYWRRIVYYVRSFLFFYWETQPYQIQVVIMFVLGFYPSSPNREKKWNKKQRTLKENIGIRMNAKNYNKKMEITFSTIYIKYAHKFVPSLTILHIFNIIKVLFFTFVIIRRTVVMVYITVLFEIFSYH